MKATNIEDTLDSFQVVSFLMNDIYYAIDIAIVREIIYFKPATPLPQSPDFVEGVLDLRGIVVPIVDLRKKLGVSSESLDQSNHILILEIDKTTIGMIVDQVQEVTHIVTDQIQEPHKVHKAPNVQYLRGICKTEDRMLFLLNTDSLLTTDEQVSLKSFQP